MSASRPSFGHPIFQLIASSGRQMRRPDLAGSRFD